ncbi:MAG: DsbA family protein [Candidatus Binatia bacterium]|nr:DsbA family protein [Candidatus Binatia bacterium]
MSLRSRIGTELAAGLTSRGLRDFRRSVAETRRRIGGKTHQVHYFHQVDDPYSHLAAQLLGPLVARYEVDLVPHLVGDADAVPEPEMLVAYARKDAADIAPGYGMEFPGDATPPEADVVRTATRLLADVSPEVFVARAASVGTALWSGDRGALEKLSQEMQAADADTARAAVTAGTALRKRMGHYSGAMFAYGGEWYWGADRLGHLEERLRLLGLARDASDVSDLVRRPGPGYLPGAEPDAPPVLEYFPSLRSPYTYISMERVYDLPRRYGIELRLRPVLPMVMRGMTVPVPKRMYITLDTKREAEDEGVPFGRVCDPVGEPVERGFALYPHACRLGRGGEYLLSFARGVFAEGIDAGTEDGLRRIAERAGIDWDAAQEGRSDESWKEELEENRAAMFEAGLWGVPSFRLLAGGGHAEFATWGQDRIWLVEREIQRRLA